MKSNSQTNTMLKNITEKNSIFKKQPKEDLS
jgi:hypothetical protein